MAFPLRPLQLLCERRPSILESVPKFLTSLDNSPATAASSSAQRARSKIDHLDTKYGLRLSFENGKITTVRIVRPLSQPTSYSSATDSPTTDPPTTDSPTPDKHTSLVDNNVPSPSQPPKPRYSYRLFPDWQTSYLWYDTSSQHAPADGHVHVDENDISSRYPTLHAYYFAWQEVYESAFEKQGCHLGAHAEVFPDAHERATWEVEGCLIACWLALGEDVEGVEYRPGEKAYLLKGDGAGDVLEGFLKDIDTELGDRG